MSYDREERSERKPQKPIRYTYRYQKSPKTPEVHGNIAPKMGEIVSTKAGPAKVLEVFWRSATDADVLLRPVESETKTPVDVKKTLKVAPKVAPKAAPRPRAPKAKQ